MTLLTVNLLIQMGGPGDLRWRHILSVHQVFSHKCKNLLVYLQYQSLKKYIGISKGLTIGKRISIMKITASLILGSLLFVSGQISAKTGNKVIYGDDNRVD